MKFNRKKIQFSSLWMALGIVQAMAQTYPERPITLVVPTAAGGTTDIAARMLAEPLGKALGQSIIVDNKAGASGNIGTKFVAGAKPDGHTLLLQYSGYHIGNPLLIKNSGWDPIKDFAPVGQVLVAPHVVLVQGKSPYKNLNSFLFAAKANAGKFNYASSGSGSLQHIGAEMLAQKAGVKMTHIPYKGASPALTDLLGGNVDVFITTPPSAMGFLQNGSLRALAITSQNRSLLASLRDVPTTDESGLKGFTLEAWFAVYAPAKTPAPVIARLSEELKKIVLSDAFKKRAVEQGAFALYLNPAQLQDQFAKELPRWEKTIKAGGISIDP
jgi:tripartite-type tricarboxylate transporter receptor subunit TctC